jgi:uncharacterized membrane protein YeaQ/YmgE (transglycosylase-associated protein family)
LSLTARRDMIGTEHLSRTAEAQTSREEVMELIITIVIGGIIGWLASMLMKTSEQMGIIANVIVGIVGSALGFWVAGLLGLAAYGTIARWLVAVGGAALLIYILKALGFFK